MYILHFKNKKTFSTFFLSAEMQNSFWYHCWDGVMWHVWRIWFMSVVGQVVDLLSETIC